MNVRMNMIRKGRLRFNQEPVVDGGGSVETPPAGTETPDGETPPAEQEAEKQPLSIEDLTAALDTARKQAAGYRERLRSTEADLAKAKSPEEFAAALADIESKNKALETDLLRTRIATEHKLPTDLAALLRGETKEEIETAAKALAKYVPVATPANDPKGGLSPSDAEDLSALSPAELAKRLRNRR
jgi:hypothetical protein